MAKFVVHESPELLRRLLREYDGMKEAARILMLLTFREKRFASNRLVAKEIDAPESTVRRWRTLYTEQGIEEFLGMGQEELRHFREISASVAPVQPTSPEKLISFLNRLPITMDSFAWSGQMKQLLIETFDEVDYALVNVRVNAKLDTPTDSAHPSIYRQDFFTSRGVYVPSIRQERGDMPKWRQLLAEGKKNSFPFTKYHPAVGFDYFHGGSFGELPSAYIGTIVLLREKHRPPISHGTVDLFEQCRPFITSIFVNHIVYRQIEHPGSQLVRNLTKNLQADPPLTAREKDVILLLMHGHSYEEAADILNITKGTMTSHVRNIYRKANVTKLSELFARVFGPVIPQSKIENRENKEDEEAKD